MPTLARTRTPSQSGPSTRSAARRRAALRRQPRLSRLLAWLLSAVLGSGWLAGAGLAHAQVPAQTLPSGGQVVVGAGQVQQAGNWLIINQSTPRLGMDWQSFNIGSGSGVEFRQPGAGSIALNRVVGHNASEIFGQLRANGQVFLVNPNGVLFAPGSKVDVGGLVASTLDLTQQDFADGRFVFGRAAGAAAGTVLNQGTLRANSGGYVALFGQRVDNQGEITVDAGSVVLASGRAATISISGSGLLSAVVTPGEAGTLLNSGRITADGSLVTLTAQSAEGLAASLVNNSGIVRANTLVERQGEIWITGDAVNHSGRLTADATGAGDAGRVVVKGGMAQGSLDVSGSVSARAEQGQGGQVETSAAQVKIAAGTRVETLATGGRHGTWLIDPTDFTVAAGSGAPTTSGIGAGTLASNLNSGNVALATAASGSEPGDLFVNAPVAWTANTSLTLTASRNVNINAALSPSGAGAGLVVVPGSGGRFQMDANGKVTLPGVNATLSIGGISYTLVRDLAGLQALDGNAAALAGNYALAGDIDASATNNGGVGFNPIGNEAVSSALTTTTSFSGRLQGLGNSISGLVINRPTALSAGLLASGLGASVDNLRLVGGSVTGGRYTGALFGLVQAGTRVENVGSSTAVVANDASTSGLGVFAGGLIGSVSGTGSPQLLRVSTSSTVSGLTAAATSSVGGIAGEMLVGSITTASSSGDVSLGLRSGFTNDATHRAGGIAGLYTGGNLSALTATGAVSGGQETGGLVGRFAPTGAGTLTQSRAEGDVSSAGTAGGLVGYASGTGSISSSDALGTVVTSGAEANASHAGGAIGRYVMATAPTAVTAAGNVVGGNTAGGVIGWLESAAVNLTAGSLVSVVPTGTTKTVVSPRWSGGLVGYSSSTGSMTGLSFDGSVTATGTVGAAGGLAGRTLGAVSNSTASGAVVAGADAGGLVGRAEGSGGFTDVGASASVTSTTLATARTGGLVGYYSNVGNLLRGSASGAVLGTGVAGGLVGAYNSAGSIQNASTSVSSTVSTAGYAGGLVGDAAGSVSGSLLASITDSTARGAVTSSSGTAYVGGLVGEFTMAGGMARVEAQGNVSGGTRTGGLVGSYAAAGTINTASSTATAVTSTGGAYVGGLIGYHSGGAINTATATAVVTGSSSTGTSYVGGLVGRSGNAISNATASGNVVSNTTTTAHVGGLVGSAEGSATLSDNTATGTVSSASTTTSYVGGLVGYASNGSIVRGTATGNVNGGQYTGGLVGYFTHGSGGTIQNADVRGAVTGQGDVGGIVGYATGNGSLSNSTAIGSVSSNSGGFSAGGAAGYFNLAGGMSGVAATGNVSGAANTGGVVGYHVSAAALANVSSTATSVIGATWVGGIVGYSNASSITALASAASVTANGTSGAAGGLAGRTVGAVTGSTATGTVISAGDAGGLIGLAQGSGALSNLLATGSVSSTATSAYVGGLIGRASSGTLSDSEARGNVTGGSIVGGLVGQFDAAGNISNSIARGNVATTSGSQVGGLVGYASNTGAFTGVTATGTVTVNSSASYVGGLVGQFNKVGGIATGVATGAVSGGQRTGGLVGYFVSGGNLSTSRAEGNVSGGSYVGGLVGDFVNSSSISNSGAIGQVIGVDYVGGLVGSFYSSGSMNTVTATGTVRATGEYAGGLVGIWQYSNDITDSRATGNVTGNSQAGGLVGFAYNNAPGIVNSSAAGAVVGNSYVGGLAGLLQYTPISRGAATGAVQVVGESTAYVGGLVGNYYNPLTTGNHLSDSTASGAVLADTPNAYAGGLVGYSSAGHIINSSASGRVVAQDSASAASNNHYAGGLVGYYSAGGAFAISGGSATGAVIGRTTAGGLVGTYVGSSNAPTLSNSSATGSVQGSGDVGGLVGELLYLGITNGSATGAVVNTGTSGNTGGLVGQFQPYYANSVISDSRAFGNVSGGTYAGGLVGRWGGSFSLGTATSVSLSNNTAGGNVSNADTAGGLVGLFDGTYGSATLDNGIRSSTASGDVEAHRVAGGLVGRFQGYGGIQDSGASGDVTLTGSSGSLALGGLVGSFANYNSTTSGGQVQRSVASGRSSLSSAATLTSSTDVYGGGLIGFMDGINATSVTVVDSYATGAVDLSNSLGRLRAGGLVGYADGSLDRTYATGAVSATGVLASRQTGGLVAQQSSPGSTATSSYWATDSTGQAGSLGGTASTLAAMKNAVTFAGWDLATAGGSTQTWRLYEGQATPLLRGQLTPLTVSLADIGKVYDGTASLGSAPISVNGTAIQNPDRILVGGITGQAGTYALTAAALYSVQNGYDLSITGNANLTIGRRTLTLDGLVNDKVYDGTVAATLAGSPRLGGLVAGEDLVFQPGSGFGAQFTSKSAGTDKTVTLSGNYTLADGSVGRAANYVLPTATTTTADITPALLTAGTFVATNRIYDGTTVVGVTPTSAAPQGVIAGDVVNVDLSAISTGTLADKQVGIAKPVTVAAGALTGADAANYTLAGLAGLTVDISPRSLTVNGITANDRQYNRGTSVSLVTTGATLTGLVSGDQVEPRLNNLSGTITDKNVGSAKNVTVGNLGLRGSDAGNYTAQQGSVAVNITPYRLTLDIYAITGTSRPYDGTATSTAAFYTSWYGGDDITPVTTGISYADKNVAYNGSGAVVSRTVTASGLALAGADVGNYTLLNTTATTSGTIAPKPLAVSGVAAVNRVYDGSRNVDVNINGATVDTTAVVAGDAVSVATPGSGTVIGQVANKNVGTAKAVTVPGLTLTGTDAGNYSITSGSGGGVTVDITPKPLTAVYTGIGKVYNGQEYAAVNVTSADIVSGDAINFYIDNSYCGSNSCGYALYTEAGRDTAGRYVVSRQAGTAKPIVITDNFLVGTDAGNYTLLNRTGSTSADITPKPVTLVFSGGSKVYDGTDAATVSFNRGASGVFGVDTVTVTQTSVFTGAGAKNVGTAKAVDVSAITMAGANAGNYTVANTTATTTATVTAKPITVSGITANDRAYDGTTTVAVVAGTVGSSGFVGGDTVTVTLPSGGLSTGTVATKDVGVDKPVTVTGLTLTGVDAGNYLIDPSASGILVDITRAALTPTYAGVSRVYNGGITAGVTPTTAGVFSGDTVTFTQQAVFTGAEARNAGTGKPIAVSNIALGGASAGNYTLASTTATSTADVTPKPVTAAYTGASRVYNGVADTSAAVVGTSLQFVAGDQVGLSETARFTGDGSVGTNKSVSISSIALTGLNATNYSLLNTTASTAASITPKPLGVTGITATNRVYDGSTSVAVNVAGATVDTSAVIAGDQVTVSLPSSGISTGDMFDRHVGSNKPVAITGLTIGGSSAANYTLIGAAGLTVSISPKSLTATYAGVGKVYDGTVDAVVTGGSADIVAVDASSLGFNVQGVYTTGKHVGTGKQVDVFGTFLTGAARDNYALVNPTGSTSADITPRTLTASFSGTSKVYDGTVAATVTGDLANRVSGDLVSTTQTAEYTGANARNVGTGKAVAVTEVRLSGADSGNYQLATASGSAAGSITPKPITVNGLSNVVASDRVYDGTRIVTVTVPAGITLTPDSTDIVAGDSVQITAPGSGVSTGTLATKTVGNGKAVTVDGLTLGGTDAGNYVIERTAGITVNITPRALNAQFAGVNKVYDGSALANVTGSSADLIGGDAVLIRGSGVYTDGKNVGTAKPIDVQGATLAGTDGVNYTLVNTTGSATGDVTRKAITPSYTGGTRVYDGSTAAPVTANTAGLIAGDDVSLGGTAEFTGTGARNVGTAKAVSVTGISLGGNDAGNYSLGSTSAGTTASVTPKPVTLNGLTGVTAVSRDYDGTRSVAVSVSSSGTVTLDTTAVIAGDDVSVAPFSGSLSTGTVADKRVGTGKPVVVDGLALQGADAGNYSVAATAGVTVNITPLALTAQYTGLDKVYDGTVNATVAGGSAGIVAGDTVSIGGTGLFVAGKNAGTALAIAVTAGSLAGADAGNYTLANPTGSASASITPKAVTTLYTGGTRIYDGTVLAPVSGVVQGLVSGDAVNLAQTASFTGSGARNVGTGKAVAINGITLQGSDAANYSLVGGSSATTASTTASITPRPLGIIGLTGVSAADRDYDGTRDVVVTVATSGPVQANSADLIAGDVVTVSAPPTGQTTGTMLDKNAGSNKAVAVTGLTIGGADAANYTVATTSGVTVNITPKALTAQFTGVNRVYDGSTAATATGSTFDIVAGDVLQINASGLYTGDGARNVGNAKPVQIQTAVLAGADAANYRLGNTTGSTTADITPRPLDTTYAGGTRVYDGSNSAPVTRSTTGLIDGDAVTVSETAVFVGAGARNVGSAKAVQVSAITLAGADAGNYAVLSSTATTTASVTQRPLSVAGLTGITAVDRVYDGTVAVEVSIPATTGTVTGDVIAGDDVTINVPGSGLGGAVMLDKNAGLNKPVVLSGLTLSGADAPNYSIGGTAGLTVNITPRPVQLLGVAALDRVYDGSALVAIDTRAGSISGALSGDSLQLPAAGVAGNLADKNAGQARLVTVTGLSLAGADAGNYTVAAGAGLTVNISPRALVPGVTVLDKTYDGDTGARITLSDNRLAGDTLTLGAAGAAYASRNAGRDIAVDVTGLALTGADAANYVLSARTLTTSAHINPALLTVQANSVTKIYGDVLNLNGGEFTAVGLVAGETLGSVTLASNGTGVGASVAGAPYAVTVSNATGGSFNPLNYALVYRSGQLLVTPRPLTIASNSLVRFADEANPASFGFSSNVGGLVGGDSIASVQQPAPAGSATAPGGSVFELLPSGAVFASGDAGNYSLRYSGGLLVVLPKPPRIGDVDGASGGSGNVNFAIQVSEAEVRRALAELDRATSATNAGGSATAPSLIPRLPPSLASATSEQIGALLTADGRRISLPELLKMPLISFDPALRRLIFSAEPAANP